MVAKVGMGAEHVLSAGTHGAGSKAEIQYTHTRMRMRGWRLDTCLVVSEWWGSLERLTSGGADFKLSG